jgi:RNA polymerase sigma-70 factor (sigma-E family)
VEPRPAPRPGHHCSSTPRNNCRRLGVSITMRGVATPTAERALTESFESFFEASYERLLRTIYLVSGSRHEAEDLAQEAFVRVYERWNRVASMANPAGYLYRVALNAHRSRVRRLAVAARRTFVRQAEDPLASSDERDALRRALHKLPAGQREAVVLVEWLGMSDEEAALVLRVSPVTVRVRISRAHHALRPLLEATGDA